MSINTTLAGLSTTASSNGPDGTVDAPSTIAAAIQNALAFTATLRDTKAAIGANTDITSLGSIASINGGQLAGMRNRIINGGMQIAQRGTIAASTSLQYGGADRYLCCVTNATGLSGTISGAGFGFSSTQYGQYVSGTWTTGQPLWSQRIESFNCVDLNGKNITISGKLYQEATGTQAIAVRLSKANAINNFSTVTQIATNTANNIPNSTNTPFSAVFTLGATDATNGLYVEVFLLNPVTVTSKNFVLSDFQLEPGTVATPFEQRPIGLELSLCSRFYQKILQVQFGASNATGSPISVTSNCIILPTMRAAPTPSVANTVYSGGSSALTVFVVSPSTALSYFSIPANSNANVVADISFNAEL